MDTDSGYVAITKLIYRYADLIDSGDLDALSELFAHATVDTGNGPTLHGTGPVREMYAGVILYPDGTPGTQHVTTNLVIDVDEQAGTGTCQSYVTVFQHLDDFPLQPIYQNRYDDRFVRADGEWRFESRRMYNHRPGDISRHLKM
jgi:hypothetical protein